MSEPMVRAVPVTRLTIEVWCDSDPDGARWHARAESTREGPVAWFYGGASTSAYGAIASAAAELFDRVGEPAVLR